MKDGHTPPEELYTKAYKGLTMDSDMETFNCRLRLRPFYLALAERGIWWSRCYPLGLEFIQANVPTGSTVLEIGAGIGLFLHALRRKGYEPSAIDVAEPAVTAIQNDGLQAWLGTLQSCPESFAGPAVVCSFFVLHHLDDPVDFIASIRKRFPNAPLLLSVASGRAIRRAHGEVIRRKTARLNLHTLPPRTLSWWTEKSVETILRQAGYEPQVAVVQEAPVTQPPIRLAVRLAPLLNTSAVSRLYAYLFPRSVGVLGHVRQASHWVRGKSFSPWESIFGVGIPHE